MSEAAAALDYWKREHNQGPTVPTREQQPHRYELAEYIAALTPTPRVILELGCSSARNLAILRTYLPDAELIGIEPNPTTYAVARRVHNDWLEIHEGDEHLLSQFRDDAFDVVFTVSVLDHLPVDTWKYAYDELVRVARHHVVLLEPMIYKVCEDGLIPDIAIEADCADIGIVAPSFSYVHNYLGYDPQLVIVRDAPIVDNDAPQWAQFGALYKLAHRVK